MTHPERVHSRAQLLDKVWGDHVFIEERTVDVHVKRLREALGAGRRAWSRRCAAPATAHGAGRRRPARPERGRRAACWLHDRVHALAHRVLLLCAGRRRGAGLVAGAAQRRRCRGRGARRRRPGSSLDTAARAARAALAARATQAGRRRAMRGLWGEVADRVAARAARARAARRTRAQQRLQEFLAAIAGLAQRRGAARRARATSSGATRRRPTTSASIRSATCCSTSATWCATRPSRAYCSGGDYRARS